MMTDEEIEAYEKDALYDASFDSGDVMLLVEEIRKLKAMIPVKDTGRDYWWKKFTRAL